MRSKVATTNHHHTLPHGTYQGRDLPKLFGAQTYFAKCRILWKNLLITHLKRDFKTDCHCGHFSSKVSVVVPD